MTLRRLSVKGLITVRREKENRPHGGVERSSYRSERFPTGLNDWGPLYRSLPTYGVPPEYRLPTPEIIFRQSVGGSTRIRHTMSNRKQSQRNQEQSDQQPFVQNFEAMQNTIELPMNQMFALQKGMAEMLRDGIEMSNWAQNQNLDMTKETLENYIEILEQTTEDTEELAERGIERVQEATMAQQEVGQQQMGQVQNQMEEAGQSLQQPAQGQGQPPGQQQQGQQPQGYQSQQPQQQQSDQPQFQGQQPRQQQYQPEQSHQQGQSPSQQAEEWSQQSTTEDTQQEPTTQLPSQ